MLFANPEYGTIAYIDRFEKMNGSLPEKKGVPLGGKPIGKGGFISSTSWGALKAVFLIKESCLTPGGLWQGQTNASSCGARNGTCPNLFQILQLKQGALSDPLLDFILSYISSSTTPAFPFLLLHIRS